MVISGNIRFINLLKDFLLLYNLYYKRKILDYFLKIENKYSFSSFLLLFLLKIFSSKILIYRSKFYHLLHQQIHHRVHLTQLQILLISFRFFLFHLGKFHLHFYQYKFLTINRLKSLFQ